MNENRLTLDTTDQVFFYEQDHYYLSNFSAFRTRWDSCTFPTSEHAYQWARFPPRMIDAAGVYIRDRIREAPSAHEAFKLATGPWKQYQRANWDQIKLDIMKSILQAKADQHEYVRRKLLETGDRELIENSWRDDYWGWGPQRDGQNMLGKLWMDVRGELRRRGGAA